MSQSMLKVCKRTEPELAEKHPDAKDEVWQDRVQQWRNGFMKNARARQGNREKGGMDVSELCLGIFEAYIVIGRTPGIVGQVARGMES
jgi:hypothetical protein